MRPPNAPVEMHPDALMLFDPAFGTERPYPSHAGQWRDYHGKKAWLYNPWTGNKRHPLDIGTDPFGVLLVRFADLAVGEGSS